MNPDTGQANGASPIADLSYRSYDGPLLSRRFRWWTVALAGVRLALRNRWYWVMVAGACLPYVFYGLMFYMWKSVAVQTPMGIPAPRPPMLMVDTGGREYAMLFCQAFRGFELVWLFGIALLVGSGAIASDNRANALQIYLSRPITKADYLIGKWAGIFVPVTIAALLPALLVYAFLGAAFSNEGFFPSDPALLARIGLAGLLPGLLHASLLVGVSAWSSTARLAGAFYAGFYFLSNAVARILWGALYDMRPDEGILVQHLSAPGLIQGLAQRIFDVEFERVLIRRLDHDAGITPIPPPDPWALLAIMAALCAIGILAARMRIRAVEVVHG